MGTTSSFGYYAHSHILPHAMRVEAKINKSSSTSRGVDVAISIAYGGIVSALDRGWTYHSPPMVGCLEVDVRQHACPPQHNVSTFSKLFLHLQPSAVESQSTHIIVLFPGCYKVTTSKVSASATSQI